jgi:hypothetical protein
MYRPPSLRDPCRLGEQQTSAPGACAVLCCAHTAERHPPSPERVSLSCLCVRACVRQAYDLVAGRTNLIPSRYVPTTEALDMIPTLAPTAHDGASLKGAVSGF